MAPSDLALHISPRAARSHSISSDKLSTTGYGGMLSPPVSTSPVPAFIAASAASQIVTNDQDSQSDTWFDQHGIEPSGETALVSPPALRLVNRFLDQLLFNFLSISRSTSLASLRPAVSEVLKPKLAKGAITGADQELHEYLGGGEDEGLLALHNGLEPSGDWDLELVWKRTRLRCMVYSSLGDMEEEDEDFYTEQEQLDGPPSSSNPFSDNSGIVSPAVAIFLTSILEFMGEQVLVVAGQAAYHRLRAKHEKEEREGTGTPADIAERVVVDESDMERVALDRTLGRLWRGWKKRIRSPTTSVSMGRSFSRESMRSQPQTSRAASVAPEDLVEEDMRRPSLAAVLADHEYAAGIPLPLSEDDVREIEIPGLVSHSDDEEDGIDSEDLDQPPTRPRSLVFFNHDINYLPTLSPHTPIFAPKSRKRSHSVPTPAILPYASPSAKRSKRSPDEEVDNPQDGSFDSTSSNEKSKGQVENAAIVTEFSEDNGVVAGVVAGAMAIGATAIAGIVAGAKGEAPQTTVGREEVGEVEDFGEEPEILTSSRVSVSGRISPDDAVVPSRKSSVRSHSVHSLRLIDVAPPKSPSRSGTGSVDTHDVGAGGRPAGSSRPSSVHSSIQAESQTPRVSSPVSRGVTSSPFARNGSSLSTRHPINAESISEVEERESSDSEEGPSTAVPSDLATAMHGVDVSPEALSTQFASEALGRETAPNPASFILSAAPPARHGRTKSDRSPSDQQNVQQSSNLAVGNKSTDSGVPPLTPLREMMEGAPDTSDEASSIAPSEGHSFSEHGINGHSPSVSASSAAYTQRERAPRQQPATANRNSPPRGSREEFGKKEKRPTHTSGSSSSSFSHKLKAVRTSEDSGPKTTEDKGRSFEKLIRSDQTIQYTLTPQNMRDIEAPDSPRHQSMLANSHESARPPSGRSHSSSTGKYTGVHSKAPIEVPKSPKLVKSPVPPKPTSTTKPVTRPASNTGAKLRPNAAQPRDARVDRESMGDFAEFIKSTGPTTSYEAQPRSTPKSNGPRGTNGLARTASSSEARVGLASTTPRRAESSAGRRRLQARDAVVPRGDSISDLIDFVRSGPQLDSDSHRIPRTVAPFRSTMDSDQMSGAVGGKAIDASLPDPRYSQASTSFTSSVNSQSALITAPPKMSKPLPIQKATGIEEEDMMPKRKTRRVRDMYQIDFSDEEDEFDTFSKTKPPVQEESLAEFLRNVPPPNDSSPAPVYQQSPAAPVKKIKKKSSTPGLMSRFSRSGASPQPAPKPKSSGQDSRSSVPRTTAPQIPSHTPIAVQFSTNYKPSAYEPARSNTYVTQLDSARNKVAQKSYQPREAVYSNTRTNDLATFLRESEPPSAMHAQPQTFSPAQREESSAFQRMFGRKKVH